jgi:hypothetical protein
MALRLEKLRLAPKGFYDKHSRVWDMPVATRQPSASQQPSPIKIRIKQIGKLHAATVLGAVRRGAINSFDASQLIGLQPSTFPKIEAALG